MKIIFYIFLIICFYLYIYMSLQQIKLSDEYFNSINELNYEEIEKVNNIESNWANKTFVNHFYYSFLKFSRFAYKDEKLIKKVNESFMNWDVINYGNKSKDNYFYTFKNDKFKTVIIAFPGTLTIPQLLEEYFGSTLIKLVDDNNILINEYFGKRVLDLMDLIFNEEMKKLIKNNYQIIATGHSLGGAMAQAFIFLALFHGKVKKENLPMTITYGQPKVGNIYFVSYLEKNSFKNLRFFNKNDIVHLIPFCSRGLLNQLKYFFGYMEYTKIYTHTTMHIEKNIQLDFYKGFIYFINFVYLLLSRVFLLLILLAIICLPFYGNIKLLYDIWSDKEKYLSKLDGEHKRKILKSIIILTFLLYIYFFDLLHDIFISIFSESKKTITICIILLIILFVILIYLLVSFCCELYSIVCQIITNIKKIDNIKNTFSELKNCISNLDGIKSTICLIFKEFLDAVYFMFKTSLAAIYSIILIICFIPHIIYQKVSDFRKNNEEQRTQNIMGFDYNFSANVRFKDVDDKENLNFFY